jgi:hypothetical protein
MNRRNVLSVSAVTAMGLALLSGSAISAEKPLKEQLTGTWVFVGSTGKLPDGSPQWGANPKGQMIFEANGNYSNILMRSDLPKYASNNRLAATAEENKRLSRV